MTGSARWQSAVSPRFVDSYCTVGSAKPWSSCTRTTWTRSLPALPRMPMPLASANVRWILYTRAAEVAGRVSASAEAVRYLERALELLLKEPETVERDRRELGLLLSLSPRLLTIEGYSSLRPERTLERARLLALALKRRRDALVAANGLWGVRLVGGNSRAAYDLAAAAVDEAVDEPDYLALGHESFGGTLLFLGDPAAAIVSFRKALETHQPGHTLPMASGTDLPMFSLAWGAHALWLLGESAQAQSWSRRAIDGADAIADPFMQTLAHAYAAILAQFRGDLNAIEEHSAVASGLSRKAWLRVLPGVGRDPDCMGRATHRGRSRAADRGRPG